MILARMRMVVPFRSSVVVLMIGRWFDVFVMLSPSWWK